MKITPIELKALGRVRECCEDSASGGHDVPKEMMQRLMAVGVVRTLGFGRHETTEFGDWVLAQPPEVNASPLALPHSWTLVPAEPDDAMQAAGAQAIRIDTTAINKIWTGNAVFRAMIAAAPIAPVTQGVAKDTERLRWLAETGARISWSVDGEYCAVWLPDERDGTESRPAEGYPLKCYDSWHCAIDAAIAVKAAS